MRWRASGELSWSTLLEAPEVNGGFVEMRGYVFEKPRAGWELRIDDEPLQDDPASVSCWRWAPLFFAGEVTAELIRADRTRPALYLLDVSPEPQKLGREVFAEMIRELWEAAPALVIGSEPATLPIGELGASEDPWLAFARLRCHAPHFLRALAAVCARPRRTLRSTRASTAPHLARRVDRYTVTAALSGRAASFVFSDPEDAPPLEGDTRLDVPVVEETFDAAVNRTLLALVRAVRARAHALLERLQLDVDRQQESATRTPLSARWPARRHFLAELVSQLTRVGRRHPFSDIRRPEISAAGLTAIAADPEYSRAWGKGWRAIRRGFEAAESQERMWMSPSWEVYERWCFLRMGQALSERFPDWVWQRLEKPHCWTGIGGGRRATLWLQPKFPSSADEQGPRMWSVSRQRVPDLVLDIKEEAGDRYLVLDAKYSTSRTSVLEAMESAHIYQDSLRIGTRRAEASLLLVPAATGADWLEKEPFHAEHRVGVHVFSPAGEIVIPKVVIEALSDEQAQSASSSPLVFDAP